MNMIKILSIIKDDNMMDAAMRKKSSGSIFIIGSILGSNSQ
ncbi:MAG: hypothetical protein SPJ62_10670 [Inconstantimicrobium porci]|nr:hypothetical protein [Inconstantimicrobium porci]MDD6770525.1 hypothetical protein [Inconstantimicrobium porci]MDY5912442.1 hypothetical protein [Inconstantimicrobium porci]